MGWKHGTDVGSIPKSRLLTSRLDRVPWKATDEERTMPLPGDDLVPSPLVETTYAVTIHAAPEQVWSWLVQLGHGRAAPTRTRPAPELRGLSRRRWSPPAAMVRGRLPGAASSAPHL